MAKEVTLPTPLKTDVLAKFLFCYPDKDFVLRGCREGFSLFFEGIQSSTRCINSTSFLDNEEAGYLKVAEELGKGRIGGPCSIAPFDFFKCSPLGLRAKPTPGKFRILHNLSAPHDWQSVNYNIPDCKASVKYTNIKDAINIMNSVKINFLAKSDIAEAFRLLPIKPSEYNLTGFKLGDKFYFDKCLPMGCRSACYTFERFSDALLYIAKTTGNIVRIIKILDDFLILAPSYLECQTALSSFIKCMTQCGVPLAPGKTVGPAHTIEFLGYLLDAENYIISIPKDKIARYLKDLRHMKSVDHTNYTTLKSLIGKLQFCVDILITGACFLRSLHDASMGDRHPERVIPITLDIKLDLEIWEDFLVNFNGKSIINPPLSLPEEVLHIYSDSSLSGFGGYFRNNFITGTFPSNWDMYPIQTLETYPILALLGIFASHLRRREVWIHCDNAAVVGSLNRFTTKHKPSMVLLRGIVLLSLKFNFKIKAVHIPGTLNVISDALSRGQVSEYFLQEAKLKSCPAKIPRKFLCLNWLPRRTERSVPPTHPPRY